jgi:hypothetical protein
MSRLRVDMQRLFELLIKEILQKKARLIGEAGVLCPVRIALDATQSNL